MKSLFEELGGTYRQVGDYLIPDIELPERNYEIGKYGVCAMLNLCYTNSAMCSYFRESVLPNDPELLAAFQPLPTKRCKYCGKPFPVDGRNVYCSEKCANAASREQTAARVRKYRENRGPHKVK